MFVPFCFEESFPHTTEPELEREKTWVKFVRARARVPADRACPSEVATGGGHHIAPPPPGMAIPFHQ